MSPENNQKWEIIKETVPKTPTCILFGKDFPASQIKKNFKLYFFQMRISSLCGVCVFLKNFQTTKSKQSYGIIPSVSFIGPLPQN